MTFLWKFTIFFVASLNIVFGDSNQKFPFKAGESLFYTAKFNFIPAGSATLKIISTDTINGNATYHIQYAARTGSFADKLFKIRDQVDSWIDKKELFVLRQKKSILQGNYKKNSHTDLHYPDSIAIVNHDTIPIYGHVFDPYSLFYYLRTIPLTKGETLNIETFDNRSFTEFQLRVDNIETISVPAGQFSCLVIRPFKDGKTLLKNEGDMTIWFSNDGRKIPIQILVKLKFGTMNLKLKSFNL